MAVRNSKGRVFRSTQNTFFSKQKSGRARHFLGLSKKKIVESKELQSNILSFTYKDAYKDGPENFGRPRQKQNKKVDDPLFWPVLICAPVRNYTRNLEFHTCSKNIFLLFVFGECKDLYAIKDLHPKLVTPYSHRTQFRLD